MKTLIIKLQKTKAFFIHIVMRSFWGGMWQYFTLIATLEVIAQSLICHFENDWSLNNIWHVIAWSFWLAICIVFRIARRANYA
jgi:hypothetical protein